MAISVVSGEVPYYDIVSNKAVLLNVDILSNQKSWFPIIQYLSVPAKSILKHFIKRFSSSSVQAGLLKKSPRKNTASYF